MLELFPEGFAELGDAEATELVAFTDEAGAERLRARFGERSRRGRARRMGERVDALPSPGRGRLALDRAALGGADAWSRPGRDRPRPRIRDRRAPDDPALPRADPASRALEPPRHRLRLGSARDRGVQTRLRARRRDRRRRGCGRGHETERGGERRPRGSRTARCGRRCAARSRDRGREHRLQGGVGAGASGAVPNARDLRVPTNPTGR